MHRVVKYIYSFVQVVPHDLLTGLATLLVLLRFHSHHAATYVWSTKLRLRNGVDFLPVFRQHPAERIQLGKDSQPILNVFVIKIFLLVNGPSWLLVEVTAVQIADALAFSRQRRVHVVDQRILPGLADQAAR